MGHCPPFLLLRSILRPTVLPLGLGSMGKHSASHLTSPHSSMPLAGVWSCASVHVPGPGFSPARKLHGESRRTVRSKKHMWAPLLFFLFELENVPRLPGRQIV